MRTRILSMIMLVAFSFTVSAQTIEGGGGIIALSTGADPNNITAIAAQTWTSGEAVFAHDAHTGTVWIYDDTNLAGAKWEVLMAAGATTVGYVATTRTLTVNGVDVILPLADGTNAGLLGGVTDAVNGVDIALSAAGVITVDLDINELTTEATVDPSADFIPMYDASATTEVKVQLDDLQDGNGIYSGSGALTGNTTVTGTGNLIYNNTGSYVIQPTGGSVNIVSAADQQVVIQGGTDANQGTNIVGDVTIGTSGAATANDVSIGDDNDDQIFFSGLDMTGHANGDVLVISDVTTQEVNVVSAATLGTDNQTIDVATVTANNLNLSLEDDGAATINLDLSTRLVTYYVDDATATTGGIGAEQEYKLDTGNPYGQPKGTIRVRQ